MGSCENLMIADDPSGGSVIEQRSCSEFPVQSDPVQKSCSEVAWNVLDSYVDLSNRMDDCKDLSTNGQSSSASFNDFRDKSSDALVSECENADMLPLQKTLDDYSQNCFRAHCGQIEVSNLESGGLCSEEKPQDEDDREMPSEFISANPSPKDEKSNIFPSAGDTLAAVEDKINDACNHISDFGHSELSLESEPMTGFLVNCHKKNEQEDIMRNTVVDNCDALCGVEAAFCRQIFPSRGSEVLANALYAEGGTLCGMEVAVCKQISSSQGSEVPPDALYTEVESTSDQPHDQKDGEDCNGPYEEGIKKFVNKESSIDTQVPILSSPSCQRTMGGSLVAYSLNEATQLAHGMNKSDIDPHAEDVTKVLEQNIDVISEINVERKYKLQIADNACKFKDISPETTTNCTVRKTISPESGHFSVVSISNSPSKDVPVFLLKDNNCSISYSSSVGNSGQTDNEGKDIVKVDCITESKCLETVSLPSRRNSRRSKSGCKTQTKRASRKCNKKSSVPHPGWDMKIILKDARKKRSCSSKPARSSIWGLLGNIKQFFEQDSELGVNEVMCQGLGKDRGSCQSGKTNKNGANSSSLSSMHKCSSSTTRVRLKIKVGKGFDLSYPNVLVPEVVDGSASASASTSYLRPGSVSQKVASNTVDKLSEEVAMGKFESYENIPDKEAVVRNGQIADNHFESTALMEKSDGDAQELCLVNPSMGVVETLMGPVNIKGMDPGTSPDSEVINSIPEVQVGERHQEGVHDTDLGSSKEFISPANVTGGKRGKKKDKLTYSTNCTVKDGSQGPSRKNKAKYSRNHGRNKNFSDVVSSMELLTSSDINALSNSVSCKELHTEPLHLSGEIEDGDTTGALKVKSSMEVKTHCCPAVDHGFSESHGYENLLSPERPLGRKLPKSFKSSEVSKIKSKASESKSRKKTACRREEKQQRPVNKSSVKGKGVSDQVICEVEDRLHIENGIDGKLKLDAIGKINAGNNKVSATVSNLDMVPGVGLGERHLSPNNAWVRCDDCHKWRRIPSALADLIEETNSTWKCKDSNDKALADCSIPQEKSNADINAELGLSDASGEEDASEDCKNYKELYQRPMFPQESTFTRIYTNEFMHRSRKTQTIDEIMVCHCKLPPKGQLGCGDECLNRMLNIECVQGACPCGDLCSNQQFQNRNYARLKWFKCGKKGYGLKALEAISKGQFLIEYVGEVLDVHSYEARQREYALKCHRHFYFMTLNGSEVIDASAKGNLGRFINHSCDPNCRTEKWMVNGEICIGLFAVRDIKQDEEVTFDYNYVRVFGAAAKKCYCGSPQCRGYIGGDPHNAEIIVQGDSDEEFPEPVMLTEDGEVEDSMPRPSYYNNVDIQTARHMIKDWGLSDSTNAIGPDGSLEKESSMNPASAISQLHSSLEVEDPEGNALSSVQVKETSQQMEDVTSKPMPVVQQGHAVESELSDKASSIQKLETSSPTSVSKSKSEKVEDRHGLSKSRLLVKTSQLNGSVKKGKVCANPPNGLKTEVTTNRLQVSSMKLKKVVEGSSNGRFEAVQEKLNELLDGDGGISKRKDATRGYLKLLLLTVASGDRSNGEAIQSNRDLSMILDALLKTKSRAVLNDIINKNGLRMLHNIMKQYRRDFKKIPILRKLLKVLEYLAASKILTFEHINGGPPCCGMESFRVSMLSLTEHDDKQVHQIARSFRDRWIPRAFRKHGYMDRDDGREVESYRSFNCNRFSASQNYRREQDLRPTEAKDCVQLSMPVTTSVNAGAQEGCSAPSLDGCEVNGERRRKRKSRWDQPAETNLDIVSCERKEQKINTGLLKQTDGVINSVDGRQNISEDVPPGFSCLFQTHLGSLNASLKSGDLDLQNAGHSGCPSDVVIGHPKEKFNSRMPVSYGIPWSVVQQYGTVNAEIAESWVTAPGMPFNPFPPLPPYPRDNRGCQPSDTANPVKIDQPAEVGKWDSDGLVGCSDDMTPSTTGANAEDVDLSYEEYNHISKRAKGSPYDLGRSYFRQQKWNKSKIPRPWSRRNAWECNGNNSRGGMCRIGVGDVPEDAICRAEKGDNNIYQHSQQLNQH